MKKLTIYLFAILLSACASTEVKKTQPKTPSMNDAQLNTLLVGKTIVSNDNGTVWTTTFNPDGSLDGTYGSDSDKGTYILKNNMYCSVWKKWRKGSGVERCWSIRNRVNDYYATIKSSTGDSFKFTVR